MATSFSYTNKTASTKALTPIDIDPISQYARTEDTATSCELKNKTAALGQGELLSYQCTDVKNISTKQPVLYPAPVTSGVQYIVRLDELLRTTKEDGTIMCDEPIVMYLTVRHPSSSNIKPAHIEEIFNRLCGALQRDDGTMRFDDLMLSALTPTSD